MTIKTTDMAKERLFRILRFAAIGILGGAIVAGIAISSQNDGESTTDAAPPQTSVATTSAVTWVNADLLGDGNYTGDGDFTTLEARKAYNSSLNATAVAAKVSVPGANDLCLFWHVGGQLLSDGLVVGDTLTRAFSVWGAAATAGSPADDMVRALMATPEGVAVRSSVGC